jgi:hypothetical protein
LRLHILLARHFSWTRTAKDKEALRISAAEIASPRLYSLLIDHSLNADSKMLSASEHQGDLMKALLVVGGVLNGFGVVSLAYFASPVRILLQASLGQQKLHLLIPTWVGQRS